MQAALAMDGAVPPAAIGIATGKSPADGERIARLASLGELPLIAHEIRQPLAAITTFARAGLRWLDRDAPDLEEARRALEKAAEAADRAASLVEGIGRLARRGTFAARPLPVDDLFPEAVAAAAARTGMVDEIISLEIEAPGCIVRGDRTLLGQVVVNLLSNALQAVRDCDHPRVVLRSLVRGGSALIEISDNGPGFSHRARSEATSGFYSSRPGGMGAGLLFSRCALEAMGGKLLLGETGRLGGATLTVMLPALA